MTSTSAVGDLVGQQLDEYRLDALLGQGGMACVYRGLDIRLNRETAIKVINPPFHADAKYVTRFEREAQAIAQLDHPNVVRVYRYGEANSLLYIAMEYIKGDDLKDVMTSYQTSQAFFPSDKASQIIRQICQTLDYIHNRQIIHRDIKPSNIIVDKEDKVILTDFGLALLTELGTQGGFLGTPNYMAPEQVLSSANAVPQSDLYAVGVILYEIFTARLPFVAGHPDDVARMHLDEPPPPPHFENPDLSPEVEAVILKALAKEPQNRYPTGAALADALDQALQATSETTFVLPTEYQPHPNYERRNHMSSQPTVFISYSREDEAEKVTLLTHLNILNRDGQLDLWSDDKIKAGETWQRQISEAINRANVAILLISANFLSSEFIMDQEVNTLLQRRRREGLIIFPVIAKACAWDRIDWLNRMEIRPRDGRPVWGDGGSHVDADLAAIAREVAIIIEKSRDAYTDDMINKFLGRYQLISLLGQGGMAKVYKTFHPGLNRNMAVKVMDSRFMDESTVERFQEEAATVADLRHDHIVRVYDFDYAEGKHYMVMELINGPTLRVKLDEQQQKGHLFAPNEIYPIVRDLAAALDYAHNKGVVHHDLKPTNILFTTRDSKGRLLLTDFGIARIMGATNLTMPGRFLGTPSYTSPEQAQGKRGDTRSDIYSLGVILYEMATGHLPFVAGTAEAILRKHIDEPPPPPTTINAELPDAIEQVILKALRKDPADRYQTAGSLAIALKEAIAPEPEPPQKDKSGQKPVQPIQRELPETINRFNEGCASYGQALNALQAGNTSGYETKLMVAAREVVGALEWALKVYLRQVCRGTQDYAKPERANFHQLMTLMKKYADPPLPPEIKGHLYDYRDMRNAAEHQPGIPASAYLGDAIKTIRWVMVTYLSTKEEQLDCTEPSLSPPPTTPPPTPPSTPPSPPTDFNIRKLRRMLDQMFNDSELDELGQDYFYEEVYNKKWTRGMRKDEKISVLLDYCRRTPERQARLLEALKEYDE